MWNSEYPVQYWGLLRKHTKINYHQYFDHHKCSPLLLHHVDSVCGIHGIDQNKSMWSPSKIEVTCLCHHVTIARCKLYLSTGVCFAKCKGHCISMQLRHGFCDGLTSTSKNYCVYNPFLKTPTPTDSPINCLGNERVILCVCSWSNQFFFVYSKSVSATSKLAGWTEHTTFVVCTIPWKGLRSGKLLLKTKTQQHKFEVCTITYTHIYMCEYKCIYIYIHIIIGTQLWFAPYIYIYMGTTKNY